MKICIDCAAHEFHKDTMYDLAFKSSFPQLHTAQELTDLYTDWYEDALALTLIKTGY